MRKTPLKALYRKLYDFMAPPFMRLNPSYTNYNIGEWTYGRPTVLSWGEGAALHIGKFCAIADGVTILLGGEHNIHWVTTYPFNKMLKNATAYTGHPRSKGDIRIGNDVWIGRDAMILSGVTIKDGAVIGARAVVTGDVAHYSVVVGNPARHIKFRFNDAIIAELLNIAWWDWSLDKIEEAMPLLLSTDIEKFIETYRSR